MRSSRNRRARSGIRPLAQGFRGRAAAYSQFERLEQRTLLATITWDGGGDGESWHDGANWAGDVLPGAADDVRIELSGSDPVIRFTTGSATVQSVVSTETISLEGGSLSVTGQGWMAGTLSITGGGLLVGVQWRQLGSASLSSGRIDGDGAFVIKGAFDWTGGSLGDQSAPSGRIIIAAGATMTINGDVTLDRVLVNDGTLDWQTGTLTFERGQLFNMAGRTIDPPGGAAVLSGAAPDGRVVNRGTINVADGATIGVQYIQVAGGTTNLTGGTLSFRRGGFIDGAVTTGAGTVFRSAGDVLQVSLNVLPTAAFTIGGQLSVTQGRLGLSPAGLTITDLSVSGGSITFYEDATIVGFLFAGGAMGGPGEVLLTGTLTWTDGLFATSAAGLVIGAGAEMDIEASVDLQTRRPIRVLGTLNWAQGNVQVFSLIHVEAGGAFNASAEGFMSFASAAGGLIVDGTMTRSGTGDSWLDSSPSSLGVVLNTGATVQSGRLIVRGTASLAGTFTIAEGAVLALAANAGVPTGDPGAVFTGPGTLVVLAGLGGTLGDTVAIPGTIETARFEIRGPVDLDGAALNSAVTELRAGGFIVGQDDLVLPEGFLWTGGGFRDAGTTINPAGSTLTINNHAIYRIEREFINRGTITMFMGRIHLLFGSLVSESGSVVNMVENSLQPGIIVGPSGGTFDVRQGATLNVTGGQLRVELSGTSLLEGTINKDGAGRFDLVGATILGRVNVNAGDFVVAAGAVLSSHKYQSVSPWFNAESSITGPGTFRNGDSRVTVSGVLDIGRLESPNLGPSTSAAIVLQSQSAVVKRAGTVVLAGGTLSIQTETLEVTGNFEQAGGTLEFNVNGPTYERLHVAGALIVAEPASRFDVQFFHAEPSIGQTFDFVTHGTRSGQFQVRYFIIQLFPFQQSTPWIPPAGVAPEFRYLPGLVQLAIVPG